MKKGLLARNIGLLGRHQTEPVSPSGVLRLTPQTITVKKIELDGMPRTLVVPTAVTSPRMAKRFLATDQKPLLLRAMLQVEVENLRRRGVAVTVLGKAPQLNPAEVIAKVFEVAPMRLIDIKVDGVGAVCSRGAAIRGMAGHYMASASRDGGGHPCVPRAHIPASGGSASLAAIRKKKKNRQKELLVLIEAETRRIAQYTQELQKLNRELDEDDHDFPTYSIFHRDVDEAKLADAFREVYEHFLGENREEMLNGDFRDAMALTAYLYILVDRWGMGRDNFFKRSVKPFYDYVRTLVIPELKGTRRTLYNRLNKDLEYVHLSAEEKKKCSPAMQKSLEPLEKDYKRVCGIFQNTLYGKVLCKHFKEKR